MRELGCRASSVGDHGTDRARRVRRPGRGYDREARGGADDGARCAALKPLDVAHRLHASGFLVTIDLCVETAGAAALMQLTPKTLRNQRSELRGPRWQLRHGHAYYAIADVLDWIGTQASLGQASERGHAPPP